MTGPEHFRRAEGLAAEAAKHLGQDEGQDTAAVWAAVAHVHATLALAAATTLNSEGDCRPWLLRSSRAHLLRMPPMPLWPHGRRTWRPDTPGN